jgi:hypothetical protein
MSKILSAEPRAKKRRTRKKEGRERKRVKKGVLGKIEEME